jgi:hypothetical protein
MGNFLEDLWTCVAGFIGLALVTGVGIGVLIGRYAIR